MCFHDLPVQISIALCAFASLCWAPGCYNLLLSLSWFAQEAGVGFITDHVVKLLLLHLILYSIHSTVTDRRWPMSHWNTPPLKKRAPLTARSSSTGHASVAWHHTTEQYSKTLAGQRQDKSRKHLPRRDLSLNTHQDFPSRTTRQDTLASVVRVDQFCLWEAALESKRRCFSYVILESNVTPTITRSSDSFSTVPPIVSGVGRWCIVHNLETIIILVLLAFNFVPQTSPTHYNPAGVTD